MKLTNLYRYYTMKSMKKEIKLRVFDYLEKSDSHIDFSYLFIKYKKRL
jgi:hypothetical protein